MLASAVARLLAAEIVFLSTVDPCVRIADFVVCTQKGLALVLLGHGWDGTRLAPNCITGTAFGEALPVSVRFHLAACSAGTRHLLHEHCLGEKLVPAIG